MRPIFEEGVNDVENRTVEWLELSRSKISQHVLHAFVVLKPSGGERSLEDFVNGSVVWLARLNAWTTVVVTCFMEREKQGGYHQMLCADKSGRMAKLMVEQEMGKKDCL